MNIGLEFVRGASLGVEFPGDGMYAVLHLLILRIFFLSDELLKEMEIGD